MIMKKTLLILLSLALSLSVSASDAVSIILSDGVNDGSIKSKMERTMSALFTEANAAQEAHREMQYSSLGIPDDVQTSLSMLWDNSPFYCLDTEVVEHCISTSTGYQVRNIPLQLVSAEEGEDYQEAVLNFDKQGNMVSFHLSIGMNLFMNVIKSNLELTDLRRRQLILDYVEQFRTAYNQKDANFLEAVFSDDALIITGKVIQRKTNDGIRLPDKIEYKKQTKQQYLTNLKRVFANNKMIRVTFDEIEVMRHPVNADFYGVTLHQGYSSDRYHDDGYLFLLWDFRDEARPQIHVRTWQPDAYNKDGNGNVRIPKDEIFSLSDFDI